jgi:hypothetical protein
MRNIRSFDEINENEYHINEEAMKPERMKVVTDFYNLIASKATDQQVKSFLNMSFNAAKKVKNSSVIADELLNGITYVSSTAPEAFNNKGTGGDTIKGNIQTILKFGGLG